MLIIYQQIKKALACPRHGVDVLHDQVNIDVDIRYIDGTAVSDPYEIDKIGWQDSLTQSFGSHGQRHEKVWCAEIDVGTVITAGAADVFVALADHCQR